MACKCFEVGQLLVTLQTAKPVADEAIWVERHGRLVFKRGERAWWRAFICSDRLGDQRCKHVLLGDGPHVQLRALHHRAAVLVLASVRQQSALVEEHQGLCTVRAPDLYVHAPAAIVVRQAPLDPEGIAALQAAVASGREKDIAVWRWVQIGNIRWHRIGVAE